MTYSPASRFPLWNYWLGRLARLGLVAGPLVFLGGWLFLPWLPSSVAKEMLHIEVQTVTWRVQLLGAISSLPGAILHVLLFLQLVKLFGLWERGIILEDANVHCFHKMGTLYLVSTVAAIVMMPVRSLALSIENPPGQRAISIGLDSDDIRTLFLGIFLWLLAYVLEQGRKYRQDTELTV
jgi:hypothetical protein